MNQPTNTGAAGQPDLLLTQLLLPGDFPNILQWDAKEFRDELKENNKFDRQEMCAQTNFPRDKELA